MSRIPRQPNDARLSRDGTVKVAGLNVGFWWKDGNDLYHFGRSHPSNRESQWGVVTAAMRHDLMSAIPEYLARLGKLPKPD